jgi:hypothetical protein
VVKLIALPLLPPLFVLAYGVLFLSTPPASTNIYIPYALATGPMALVGLVLLGLKTRLIWVILVGTYALYLAYGLALHGRATRGGNVGSLLGLIAVIHAACGMVFMYLSLSR